MDGLGGSPVIRGIGPKASGLIVGTGGFRPNATSAPSFFRGTLKGSFTVTYGATGLYTVSFTPTGFKFKPGNLPVIIVQATHADGTGTNRFDARKIGDWDNTNRRFVIGAFQEATAFAVPSDANNWIDFVLYGIDK